MEELFSYYSNFVTGIEEPHLHFKDNEDCFADLVIQFKPLFCKVVKKYKHIQVNDFESDLFSVYIDCILDCTKRYDPERSKVAFSTYLKVSFQRKCMSAVKSINRDKRKIHIGTVDIDDLFEHNQGIKQPEDSTINDIKYDCVCWEKDKKRKKGRR